MATVTLDYTFIPADKRPTEPMTFTSYDDYVEVISPFIGEVGASLLRIIQSNPAPADLVNLIQTGDGAERLAAYIALAEKLDLRKTGEDFWSKYVNRMQGQNASSYVQESFKILAGGNIQQHSEWVKQLNLWTRGQYPNPRAVPVAYVMALLTSMMQYGNGSFFNNPSDGVGERVDMTYGFMFNEGQITVDTTPAGGGGGGGAADPDWKGSGTGSRNPKSTDTGNSKLILGLVLGAVVLGGIFLFSRRKTSMAMLPVAEPLAGLRRRRRTRRKSRR